MSIDLSSGKSLSFQRQVCGPANGGIVCQDVPYLVQYMRITWKEPLISILPPAHPVRFRPGFTNYLAFGLGYQADRALLRRVVKAARARRMEGEGRTIVVVLWHKVCIFYRGGAP